MVLLMKAHGIIKHMKPRWLTTHRQRTVAVSYRNQENVKSTCNRPSYIVKWQQMRTDIILSSGLAKHN